MFDIVDKINQLKRKVSGNLTEFDLQSRIFHMLCFYIFLLLIISIPFNVYFGIWENVWMICFYVVLQSIVLYLSRIKRKPRLSISLFAFFLYFALAANYIINAGVNGPNGFIIILGFSILVASSMRGQYLKWLLLHLVLFGSLLCFEYFYPEYILNRYENREFIFIDYAFTFSITMFFLYFILDFLRVNYINERRLAMERAKSMEEQRKFISIQNTELNELNNEKDKLLSIISHDLKSPLNSIATYLKLLESVEFSESERKEVQQTLLEQTQATMDMLTNVLHWTSERFKGEKLSLSITNPYEVTCKIFDVFTVIAANKSVKLINRLEPTINIKGDCNMLEIILRNLINNAIKFTRPGDSVIVGYFADNEDCVLYVKDNGIGMSDDVKSRIFTLNNSSTLGTNGEKGFGLGLSLCRDFVEKQNGKIWFDSTEGEGSTFYVSFKCL